jgi:hypothetical protein
MKLTPVSELYVFRGSSRSNKKCMRSKANHFDMYTSFLAVSENESMNELTLLLTFPMNKLCNNLFLLINNTYQYQYLHFLCL